MLRDIIDVLVVLVWGIITVWLYIRYDQIKADYNHLMQDFKAEQTKSRQLSEWLYTGRKEGC